MTAVITAPSPQWLWYVSRGSGLVLLVLFSVVVALGVAVRTGSTPRSWQRFALAEVHRTLSLFAIAFLGLHVATAVADPYVSIGWWATVLPFASHYRAAAISAGALAVDLGAAIVVTSLVRRRLGFAAWKAVHWTAYAAWPLAFVHSLTAGNDLGIAWVAAIEWGSLALVATSLVARLLHVLRPEDGRSELAGPPRDLRPGSAR